MHSSTSLERSTGSSRPYGEPSSRRCLCYTSCTIKGTGLFIVVIIVIATWSSDGTVKSARLVSEYMYMYAYFHVLFNVHVHYHTCNNGVYMYMFYNNALHVHVHVHVHTHYTCNYV